MSKLEQNKVWKIVRDIRKSFLSKYASLYCNKDTYEVLLSTKIIRNIIDNLSEKLEMNTTSHQKIYF